MVLEENKYKVFCEILKKELLPAMGCTEPIAIAYAAAIAADLLTGFPDKVEAKLSGNIIKNVKSVTVPNTGGLKGIAAAIAAGIVAKYPERKLEVLAGISEQEKVEIKQLIDNCNMDIKTADTDHIFDIILIMEKGNDRVEVRIVDYHTNLVLIKKNNKVLYEVSIENKKEEIKNDMEMLSAKDIVAFADTVELDDIREVIERQIAYNMAIAEEGIMNNYGSNIGTVLLKGNANDVRTKAKAMAAAGSDARMNGCEMPVVIVSGSGNQGITSSVPVIVYGTELKVSHEKLIRAVVLSDLFTIYQKKEIGRLSAYCGAISAGCGCGAGICYLHGGAYKDITHTVVNAIAILSGTICDGAKSSCAAKIAMAVEAGILGFEMYRDGQQFYSGEGIITKGIENTIKNIGLLARDGMKTTDSEIMKIMLSCQ